jgi:hypothetical protein
MTVGSDGESYSNGVEGEDEIAEGRFDEIVCVRETE